MAVSRAQEKSRNLCLPAEQPPPIKSDISAGKPMMVYAGLNHTLQFADEHERKLKNAFARQVELVTPSSGGRDAIRDMMAGEDADIVYLYCHALATAGTPKGHTVGPVFDFGEAIDGIHRDILKAEDFDGDDWSHAPLVFMNGCGSAGFSP